MVIMNRVSDHSLPHAFESESGLCILEAHRYVLIIGRCRL